MINFRLLLGKIIIDNLFQTVTKHKFSTCNGRFILNMHNMIVIRVPKIYLVKRQLT